ncbi:single-stranded DNA-binding protein, partial [Neisseria gonorrhoeae]|nr:single-stranded DNA-binding protein [Neisseria gonorrhoeae]
IPLAENYFYTKDGKKVEATNYFWIDVYGEQAKNAVRYCGKGSLILIEGRISNNNYEKDGQKIYKDQMIASRIEYSNLKPPAGREESSDPSFIYDPEQDLG